MHMQGATRLWSYRQCLPVNSSPTQGAIGCAPLATVGSVARLLRCRWRENMDAGREALTHAIGRIVFEAGLEGVVVPSAQARKGQNLVVFPSNLQTRSSLVIQNVQ